MAGVAARPFVEAEVVAIVGWIFGETRRACRFSRQEIRRWRWFSRRWNRMTRPRATTGALKPWPTSIFHSTAGPDFGHVAADGPE